MMTASFRRTQASDLLTVAGAVCMIGIGARRYLRDASFWVDEAPIALTVLNYGTLDFFSELVAGLSFPRWYLLLIGGVEDWFGYETWALRLLPHLCFILASCLWLWLLRLRFRSQPLVLAFGILLVLIPNTWFVYSTMLKQYTFDVLLALIPFALSDDFFDRTLREGRAARRGLFLALLCAVSYTLVIPLLGRVLGWYATRYRQGQRALDTRATSLFVAGLVLACGSLWFTDLRHSPGWLAEYWGYCVLGHEWQGAPAVLHDFAFGWYEGRLAFQQVADLALGGVWAIRLALGIGVLGVLLSALRGAPERDYVPAAWGSRSLGALVSVLGVVGASLAVSYPLCPGRLTLFVLPFLQILTLEGVSHVLERLERVRWGRVPAIVAAGLLIAVALPAAYRNTSHLVRSDIPGNMRPLLVHVHEAKKIRPVLVSPCATKQVRALPEGLGERTVLFYDELRAIDGQIPWGRTVWILDSRRPSTCSWFLTEMKSRSIDFRRFDVRGNTAGLFLARFPKEARE